MLRYLGAFGPASVADAQKWSGLTRLSPVFTRLASQLRRYDDDRGRQLFDLADRPPPDPELEAPVRFVPEFDSILLAHADRHHVIADEHRTRVFTSNGIIRATILVDGFVRGCWNLERAADRTTLVIEPFGSLTRDVRASLAEEGEHLLRFAALGSTDHDIRILRPPGDDDPRSSPSQGFE